MVRFLVPSQPSPDLGLDEKTVISWPTRHQKWISPTPLSWRRSAWRRASGWRRARGRRGRSRGRCRGSGCCPRSRGRGKRGTATRWKASFFFAKLDRNKKFARENLISGWDRVCLREKKKAHTDFVSHVSSSPHLFWQKIDISGGRRASTFFNIYTLKKSTAKDDTIFTVHTKAGLPHNNDCALFRGLRKSQFDEISAIIGG